MVLSLLIDRAAGRMLLARDSGNGHRYIRLMNQARGLIEAASIASGLSEEEVRSSIERRLEKHSLSEWRLEDDQ